MIIIVFKSILAGFSSTEVLVGSCDEDSVDIISLVGILTGSLVFDFTGCSVELVPPGMLNTGAILIEGICGAFCPVCDIPYPEKEISIGDFNKALLKIVTMAKELSNVCEEMGQIELLHKLGQIEPMILKYVTTSQSLYL